MIFTIIYLGVCVASNQVSWEVGPFIAIAFLDIIAGFIGRISRLGKGI